MKRVLLLFAAALGMLVPGACGKTDPEQEAEQVDLLDLLYPNGQAAQV